SIGQPGAIVEKSLGRLSQAAGVNVIGRAVANVAVELGVPGLEAVRILLLPGTGERIVDAPIRTQQSGTPQEGQSCEGQVPRVGRAALTGDVAEATVAYCADQRSRSVDDVSGRSQPIQKQPLYPVAVDPRYYRRILGIILVQVAGLHGV